MKKDWPLKGKQNKAAVVARPTNKPTLLQKVKFNWSLKMFFQYLTNSVFFSRLMIAFGQRGATWAQHSAPVCPLHCEEQLLWRMIVLLKFQIWNQQDFCCCLFSNSNRNHLLINCILNKEYSQYFLFYKKYNLYYYYYIIDLLVDLI